MTRSVLVRLAAGLVVTFGAWVAYTQAPPAPAQLNLQKVKDDLYMIEGDGGNVAVYLTNDGVILVDDKFERDFNDIMAKVKSLTDKPVKYVLNTHQHGDHTGSNEKLLPIAEIIAHKNARANMEKAKQPGLMRVVFSDESDVFLGGKEVRAKYYGRGHTNGDAVIYFPALRLIHTGDLFVTTTPFIDYANGASTGEWAATLDGALKLDFDTVIPGHGPVSKREDLMKFRDTMRNMSMRVSSMVREGRSKDDVAKLLTGEFSWPQASATRTVDGMMVEFKR
jgi:glyoxylase-like metal-dependent hydrolase (beta-lactamase superfamily II)